MVSAVFATPPLTLPENNTWVRPRFPLRSYHQVAIVRYPPHLYLCHSVKENKSFVQCRSNRNPCGNVQLRAGCTKQCAVTKLRGNFVRDTRWRADSEGTCHDNSVAMASPCWARRFNSGSGGRTPMGAGCKAARVSCVGCKLMNVRWSKLIRSSPLYSIPRNKIVTRKTAGFRSLTTSRKLRFT